MDDAIRRIRDRIDALDAQILELVNERARCASEIGHLKGDAVVYRPEREAQVLQRLRGLNAGPLPDTAVSHLFVEIISACRALERQLVVAYLGPRGTYSEEAVSKQFGGHATAQPAASIAEVFRSVEVAQVGYGVVPVENSTEGSVGQTLDLLIDTKLRICGEILLPIHHCLLTRAPSLADVKTVYAHAQSLGQCNSWLARHLPTAQRVPTASNAEAAKRAADEPGTAAIASRVAADLYAMPMLAENIEDDPNNTTRFLVVADQDIAPSGHDRTSFVMSAPNRPGSMVKLLEPLARHGVSMSKLESRPSRSGLLWEYVFFVDIEGHRQDPKIASALAEMRADAPFLKVLGSYPVAAS